MEVNIKNLVIFKENLMDSPHSINQFRSWIVFEEVLIKNDYSR